MRASTSFFIRGKTWMAGTSPAMTTRQAHSIGISELVHQLELAPATKQGATAWDAIHGPSHKSQHMGSTSG
jgi:hypothetical protein